jgi:hypothetical protein
MTESGKGGIRNGLKSFGQTCLFHSALSKNLKTLALQQAELARRQLRRGTFNQRTPSLPYLGSESYSVDRLWKMDGVQ